MRESSSESKTGEGSNPESARDPESSHWAVGSGERSVDPLSEGYAALSDGDVSRAATIAKKAVDRSPEVDCLRLLSEVYRAQGRLNKSASILQLARSMCTDREVERALHDKLAALHEQIKRNLAG